MSKSTRNADGTGGRYYGGDTGLIHIPDGERRYFGDNIAYVIDLQMRRIAMARGDRTPKQAAEQTLCPGCYMVALFNAATTLAKANGQSLTELGATMANAFAELAEGGEDRIESIGMILDPEEPVPAEFEHEVSRLFAMLAGGAP